MIIAITGDPGSGKSTLGKMLSAELKIPFFSMGDIRGEYALSKGMTLAELNRRAESDPESDHLVDEFQKKLPEKHDAFVIDSRLGFHFLKDAITIYLQCDVEEAAKRIFSDKRADEPWESVEEGVALLKERKASDKKRYEQLYNVDVTDMKNYDFVLDTTTLTIEEKFTKVMTFLNDRKKTI